MQKCKNAKMQKCKNAMVKYYCKVENGPGKTGLTVPTLN